MVIRVGVASPLEVEISLVTDENQRNLVPSSNLVQQLVMNDLHNLKTAVVVHTSGDQI